MGLSQQEYWSGLPFSSPGALPVPGIKPASPGLQSYSLALSHQASHIFIIVVIVVHSLNCVWLFVTPWTAACQASLSFAISWIFPTQGWNPGLLNCRQILYHLSHQGNSCIFIMCVHVKSLQLCPTLCNPMVCSPPGPSVHRILQARIMESVAMPSSRDLLDPGMEPISLMSPALAGGFFTTRATWQVPVRSLEEGVTCPSTCSIVGCQRWASELVSKQRLALIPASLRGKGTMELCEDKNNRDYFWITLSPDFKHIS